MAADVRPETATGGSRVHLLHYCEAAFAMRNISVVQTLHTRPNNLAL